MAAGGAWEALRERAAAVTGVGELDEGAVFFEGAARAEWRTEPLALHRSFAGEEAVPGRERLDVEAEARRAFFARLAGWAADGRRVVAVTSGEAAEGRARELLAEDARGRELAPLFLRGELEEGFLSDNGEGAAGVVVVTETEVFGRRRTRRGARKKGAAAAGRAAVDQLLDFSELAEGDYVVHLQHGVAHYRGLGGVETRDGEREMISLEFADGVMLRVPLQESHLISRYVGLTKARPRLGRIGSGRWEKTRRAAERATVDLAADLLRMQAVREAAPGHAFAPDTDWQRGFEAAFPFTETPDQLAAIRATKADMERARPMDRLICGDVGFGKTEVALRAAFKAVQDGRQVVVLAPTTVLAQQHLNTFRERMAGYPVSVELLSRFRTRAEQRRVVAAAAAGSADIVIGTHRLLQGDVAFKNLGLVVIDEEQRFGVRHKERLKGLRASVDVLSMSATPIPRTLYMALTGARELSVIGTPPADRRPVETVVKPYDEGLVAEVARRELRRGGQVFYLHNRVATIGAVAERLRELLPGVSVGVGHGQMEEGELERTMVDFVAGRFQVLVCTTIIESGLDIPNCNTLIIEGADRFGLSQLYQLRGRVGRSRHQAYACLLLRRHAQLLAVARERLNALRTHNQLGAGFRIAMRDLELRGAGNLLGARQSGHIAGVGFELYCQLLRQSVARLKGGGGAAALRASVSLDFVFTGEGAPPSGGGERGVRRALMDAEEEGDKPPRVIRARVPADYVGETRLRIDIYRRLALAESVEGLRGLEAELRDRFGKFGDEVRALLLATEIRVLAERKGLLSVVAEGPRLKCLRAGGRRDDFVMLGGRFPRLGAEGLERLREILVFLTNLPDARTGGA
ncbi:MAG: transcription-repair coupling factor [Opitutaceae bacterium]|nr:transcription-repair coupling factor [Opitutaceae bacterium]